MRRSIAVLAAIAFSIGGCQAAAPTAPPLTDPVEILSESLEALGQARTVEVLGQVSGRAAAAGMPLDLEGSTLTAAIDFEGGRVRATATLPTLAGTGAELIALDDTLYTKVTGPVAGFVGADPAGRFLRSALGSGDGAGDAAADPRRMIRQLASLVDFLPVTPRKAPDDSCGDRVCYHLTMSLTRTDLQALAPGTTGLPDGLDLELYAHRDDLRPAVLIVGFNDAATGNFRIQFTMTYDGNVAIEAPPADQVVGG